MSIKPSAYDEMEMAGYGNRYSPDSYTHLTEIQQKMKALEKRIERLENPPQVEEVIEED